MKSKINRFKFISLLFTILVCLFSLSLNRLIINTNDNINELRSTIEEGWKRDIHFNLINLKNNLEDAIIAGDVNLYDDDSISEWVLTHSTFKDNENILKVSLINIGYSTVSSQISMHITIENSSLSEDIKNELIKYSDSITEDNLYSNEKVLEMINTWSLDISSKYNISFESIQSILKNALFVKDKVLFSTDSTTYQCSDNSPYWIESLMIPDGSLGFNNEPIIKNNTDNLNYKKIIVTVVLNKESLMQPYNRHINNLTSLCTTTQLLLIVLSIGTILYLCINFIGILNKYNVGGDTNAEYNRNVYSHINSMLRVNGVRIKQIRNKFRKRNKKT